jgi:hypothetical protein
MFQHEAFYMRSCLEAAFFVQLSAGHSEDSAQIHGGTSFMQDERRKTEKSWTMIM